MILLKYLRTQWDRAAAIAVAIGGVLTLVVGYRGVADTQYISEQVPFVISAGFGSVLALTVAAALWISADMRDEWRELADQSDALRTEQAERRGALEDYIRAEINRQWLDRSASTRGGVG
ncbi:MAG: hypothetical protein ACT4PP_05030 [Sporichthyaceae bacterium]